MLPYEMVIAIGIAGVLIVAIGGLAARVMMGPEETALSRAARASVAQRRLMASATQQEGEARAAAAQRRRLVASAAQLEWEARAAAAQRRRLLAAATQQEREAQAAAAQRRLVAAAAQKDYWIRRCLKLQYEDALAAPLSPRLAALITQLETQ